MIINAREKHLNDIYRLMCVLENKELNKTHFEKCYILGLKSEDIYYYLYQYEDKIVGYISLYVHHYMHHDCDTGEIVELVVDENCRGQKIGSQLIEYVEDKARYLGLEEIELSTSTYRKKAHKFYETHGYIMNHYNYTKKI